MSKSADMLVSPEILLVEVEQAIRSVEARMARQLAEFENERSTLLAKLDAELRHSRTLQSDLKTLSLEAKRLRAASAEAEKKLAMFDEQLDGMRDEIDETLEVIERRFQERLAEQEHELAEVLRQRDEAREAWANAFVSRDGALQAVTEATQTDVDIPALPR